MILKEVMEEINSLIKFYEMSDKKDQEISQKKD